ncbi:hypothetical protein QR680_010418 [Steinernema hermaphroditum]|uniref:Uncharacterized protein n=1 Tax=Steinernema hermaphroditum TaxID=289476 RepID=A0AA39IQH1_9BILA|nr:hypothetical protein QR680_010418 [Steinernema hermaphroditum]
MAQPELLCVGSMLTVHFSKSSFLTLPFLVMRPGGQTDGIGRMWGLAVTRDHSTRPTTAAAACVSPIDPSPSLGEKQAGS